MMRRYPPNTIYRYLDLSPTQIIQTHNSHRLNTTPPSQTLAQGLPQDYKHYTSTQIQQ